MLSKRSCLFCTLAAAAAIPMSLQAQLGNKSVEVINPPGASLSVEVQNLPATQTVDGQVNVGNFPATQTVDGQVDIGNFPATQTVDGEVNVGNFPGTQNVSGTVSVGNDVAVYPAGGYGHLGVPIADHRRYTQAVSPLNSQFGISTFALRSEDGGGLSPVLAVGECLVVLDLEVLYRTVELIGPGTIAIDPNALAYIEVGLSNSDRSSFVRLSTLVGTSDDHGYGTFQRSYAAGLIMTNANTTPALDQLALRTVALGSSDQFFPDAVSAEASGYVIDCP